VQAVELDILLSVFHRVSLAASVSHAPGQIPPEDMSSS
jgi:hypothetical protein